MVRQLEAFPRHRQDRRQDRRLHHGEAPGPQGQERHQEGLAFQERIPNPDSLFFQTKDKDVMTTQTHLIVGPDESGNVELGEILHRFRDEAKLTRGEAADKIGLSSEYIRLAEVGKRTPALGTVRIMLKVYGIGYQVDKNVVTFDKFEV